MTQSAPAAIALAMSPLNLIPPSAITGMSNFLHTETTLWTAVNWGTPTPETILVVQIEPGPIPTLIAFAPAAIKASAAAAVATLPAIIWKSLPTFSLIFATVCNTP